MKPTIMRAKSLLFAICFILLTGTVVSAQETNSGDREKLSSAQAEAAVSDAEGKDFTG